MENRVGFGSRLGALIVDVIIVGVLTWLIGPTIGGVFGAAISGGGGQEAMALGAAIGMMTGFVAGSIVLGFLYFLIEGFTGATPGKMILGLRVGTPEGRAGSVGLYLWRYALKNVATVLGLLGLVIAMGIPSAGGIVAMIGNIAGLIIVLGCFMALGERRQALHDRIAGTAVYKRSALAPATA